jgi:hypothetical protein
MPEAGSMRLEARRLRQLILTFHDEAVVEEARRLANELDRLADELDGVDEAGRRIL